MSQELGIGIMVSPAIAEMLRSVRNAFDTERQMVAFYQQYSAFATAQDLDSPPAEWPDGWVVAFTELSSATSRAFGQLQAAEKQRGAIEQQLDAVRHQLRKARKALLPFWIVLLLLVGLALYYLDYLGVL